MRKKKERKQTNPNEGCAIICEDGNRLSFFFVELSLRCYETNARRTWHIALGPTDIPHTRRTPAAPARAPPRQGERGVTVWDGDSPSMLSPGSTTQITRGGGPAHRSGSRASSSPIYRTVAFGKSERQRAAPPSQPSSKRWAHTHMMNKTLY